MSKDSKWLKIGGYRIRDLREALRVEEETLATVNRVAGLQLKRLREEEDVLRATLAQIDHRNESTNDSVDEGCTRDDGGCNDGASGSGDLPGQGLQTALPQESRHQDDIPHPSATKYVRRKCSVCREIGHTKRTCPRK
jgi:hypothetical protein